MDSIAFHAASADDARVLLLERVDGHVRVTEWRAGAFAEPGGCRVETAAEVEARILDWQRDGWRFNESPLRILSWLRQPR